MTERSEGWEDEPDIELRKELAELRTRIRTIEEFLVQRFDIKRESR